MLRSANQKYFQARVSCTLILFLFGIKKHQPYIHSRMAQGRKSVHLWCQSFKSFQKALEACKIRTNMAQYLAQCLLPFESCQHLIRQNASPTYDLNCHLGLSGSIRTSPTHWVFFRIVEPLARICVPVSSVTPCRWHPSQNRATLPL